MPKDQLGVGADVITNHNHAEPLEDGRIVEKWSFRRSNYWEHVGNEIMHVHNKVGVLDMSAFAKMEVSGPVRVPGSTASLPMPFRRSAAASRSATC